MKKNALMIILAFACWSVWGVADAAYVNEHFSSGDFSATYDGGTTFWETIVDPASDPQTIDVIGQYTPGNVWDSTGDIDVNQARLSTNDGAAIPKTATDLDNFAKLSVGTLNALSQSNYGYNVFNGTAIRMKVQVSDPRGEMVRFDWDFITKDFIYDDFAYVAVVYDATGAFSGSQTQESLQILADKSDVTTVLSASPLTMHTTYQANADEFRYEFNNATGYYMITVGVVDVFDDGAVSELLIDDFKVHPIPEPMTMVLVGTGLVGLAGMRRKMNKK